MNNLQIFRLRLSTSLSARPRLSILPASMQPNLAYQSGAVLVISLVMLLLLTLIGTTGMQTTSLEEKMVGNMRDQNNAFQIAETVLRAGEAVVQAAVSTTVLDNSCAACAGGYYDSTTGTACPQPNWQTIDWTDPGVIATYSLGGISYAYYIERLDPSFDFGLEAGTPDASSLATSWYRITVRGVSNANGGVVLLQSTYTRQ